MRKAGVELVAEAVVDYILLSGNGSCRLRVLCPALYTLLSLNSFLPPIERKLWRQV
jgi:hypothetical protein